MINDNPGIDESNCGGSVISTGNAIIVSLQEHVDEADLLMTSDRKSITNGQVKLLLNKAAESYNRLTSLTGEAKGMLIQKKKLADKNTKAIVDKK